MSTKFQTQCSATCPFCEIIAHRAPASIVCDTPDVLAIYPLNPVTPGHILVIPKTHVTDAYDDPDITAQTMRAAARWARGATDQDPRYESANLITSIGAAATQTVPHLHVHVIPRTIGDGLALPWHDGRSGTPGPRKP